MNHMFQKILIIFHFEYICSVMKCVKLYAFGLKETSFSPNAYLID